MEGPSQDLYGTRRSRFQRMESKLSAHMDLEDRRVKELTEGILYDFLPAALNVMLPRCEDPLQELDADRCRAVASAALAVSALMNAPAGFLEFLLCVPWRKLSQLYPKTPNLAARPDSIDKLVSNLQVTDEERRKLVNTRIDPALMGTVLDFLYKDKHADSVPPMLQLTPVNPLQPDDNSSPLVVRETVAAVLDGATPLHCSALRGNPAQVDHLLYCGAVPTCKTAAGELPIELVPVCGSRAMTPATSNAGVAAAGTITAAGSQPEAVQRSCRCMGPHDQDVWECRSRLARSLIARSCFFSFGVGLFSWLRLVAFCLLCLLGQAGCYTSILRPVVEHHIDTRRQQKVAAARSRAHALVTRMRAEAEAGLRHLEQAKLECIESVAFQRGPPDISQMYFTDPNKSPPPPPPPITQIHDIDFHLQESGTSSTGEELASEKAFKCFVRSVHALQSLDLHGDVVPQVFAELVQAGGLESRETHVLEDEQAELYSCWGESVLLKFRGCTCPGCAALAIQAVRMAHIQATRLFGKVDRMKQSHAERWRAVGQALARVVYVHICLLLETEAQASPTRSLVWRAEQCLREWDRLEKAGLTQSAGVLDPRHVAALQLWAKTADSDLYLAEALHGQSMPPTKTLQEVVQGAVSYRADNMPILARPVSAEVVVNLEQAITLASLPSPMLAHMVRGVVANAIAELGAAVRLREFVGARGAAVLGGAGSGTSEAVAALTEALRAAEPFRSRLGPDLDAAQELHARWTQRVQALEKLENAVEEVRVYNSMHPLRFCLAGAAAEAAALVVPSASGGETPRPRPGPGSPGVTTRAQIREDDGHVGNPLPAGSGSGAGSSAGGAAASGGGGCEGSSATDLVEWERRMKQVEAAMNDAKDANISVSKAKRLLKEMAVVAAAAEASRQLEAVMARRPSGPLQLKVALNKAEAAASSLSSLGGAPVPGLVDVLGPLVAAARRRLDTERAADALSKAAASHRTLADLARLEAAIYNAKKIGAEELDPESYRTSLELRAHLQEAARMRTGLETALRNLQNQLRPEDAEVLERTLQEANRWEELLAPELAKARKALEHWRAMTVNDAKLARLLRDGASTGVLARAIQEAAASGVKVQQAKRVLKLMQALETGLASGGGVDGCAAERYASVKAKLDAAEQGGVTAGPLPEAARRLLSRLSAHVAREALEAALKPHPDWSTSQRMSALTEALDRAEGVLTAASKDQDEQQHLLQTECGSQCASGYESKGAAKRDARSQHRSQVPNLANASVVGKTSRGKRSSGGSVAGGGEVPVGQSEQRDDAAMSTSEPHTSSTLASSSNSSSTAASSSSSCSCTVGGTLRGDEEILAVIRELASKARRVLEEDRAEIARVERERQEAERARKEAQERERQERQRQEQERQKREKVEAAERERLLAEKRERFKADKTRQQQHQAQQQQQQQQQQKAKTAAAIVIGDTAGSGGNGAKTVVAIRVAAGKGGAGPHAAPNGVVSSSRPALSTTTAVPAVSTHAARATVSRDPQVEPPAAALAPVGGAGGQSGHFSASPLPGQLVAGLAGAADICSTSPSAVMLSPIAPAGRGTSRSAVHELFPPKLPSAAHQVGGSESGCVLRSSLGSAMKFTAAENALGDFSLDSLGEVVRSLNQEVIDALDINNDVTMPYISSPLHSRVGAPGNTAASSDSGRNSSATAAVLGAVCGRGDEPVARTLSGITVVAENTLDPRPIKCTSSVMSSIASADDVMLQGTTTVTGGAGSCLLTGVSSSAMSSAETFSTGSTGESGANNTHADMSNLLPLTASAITAAAISSTVPSAPGAGGGGCGSSNGGTAHSALAKPRFGFVDLGGASWGLDSPLLSGSGAASTSLFVSLSSSMGEFGSILTSGKSDVTGPGWSVGHMGSGAAVAAASAAAGSGGILFNGPTAGHALKNGSIDECSSRQALGLGVSMSGLNGTQATDSSSIPDLVAIHASPRTTVATASAGVHGIVQVRPLGAGGMPGTGPPLVQLAPGMTIGAAAAAAAVGMGSGTGGSGRSSMQGQPAPQHFQGGAGTGLGARSGFWTPPSFHAQVDLSGDASPGSKGVSLPGGSASSLHTVGNLGLHHLGLGASAGSTALSMLDWTATTQQQQQQQHQAADCGLQLVHLSGPGGCNGAHLLRGGSASVAGSSAAVASRICRFFLQGYCRDGERCRFVHHTGAGVGAGGKSPGAGHGALGGGPQLLQFGPGSSSQPLSHHSFLGSMGGFALSGASGGGVGTGGVGQSSAVGSFAFGAPGAEAFAPLGTSSSSVLTRASTGMSCVHSTTEAVAAAEMVLPSKGFRHGAVGASASAGMSGLSHSPGLVNQSPLGSLSMPVGGVVGGVRNGSSSGGGNASAIGAHHQPVQLRDSATGLTFSGVLTIPGTPTGGSLHTKPFQVQQQQALLLALPDDLSYSPPSS